MITLNWLWKKNCPEKKSSVSVGQNWFHDNLRGKLFRVITQDKTYISKFFRTTYCKNLWRTKSLRCRSQVVLNSCTDHSNASLYPWFIQMNSIMFAITFNIKTLATKVKNPSTLWLECVLVIFYSLGLFHTSTMFCKYFSERNLPYLFRVPTRTGKLGKMGRHFQGKVRQFWTDWKSQGKSQKILENSGNFRQMLFLIC